MKDKEANQQMSPRFAQRNHCYSSAIEIMEINNPQKRVMIGFIQEEKAQNTDDSWEAVEL